MAGKRAFNEEVRAWSLGGKMSKTRFLHRLAWTDRDERRDIRWSIMAPVRTIWQVGTV